MHVNQEITLGSGRMMKTAIIKVIKDDGLIGVKFFGKFFEKNTKAKAIVDNQKLDVNILGIRNNSAVIQMPMSTVAINWELASRFRI